MRSSKYLSFLFLVTILGVWAWLSDQQLFRSDFFPYFKDFFHTSFGEIKNGRLLNDIFASLYRWSAGFLLSVLVGVPLGLFLGKNKFFEQFLSPYMNLFRSLSPLAWIPFAVIWFGVGDMPVIFLLFLGCVFPLIFSTMNSVKNVPKVYDQLAREYAYTGSEYFTGILFPAVYPQIVGSLRLVSALGWIVIVPAEMLAGKEGLGFAILDARNGLRTDLLVFNMFMVALTSHFIDLGLKKLNQRSSVRWAHES